MTTLTSPPMAGTVFRPAEPTSHDLSELARMIERYAPYQGRHGLRLPGVSAIRYDTTTDLVHGVYRPSVCIVAQGAKRVLLGPDAYEYSEVIPCCRRWTFPWLPRWCGPARRFRTWA